VIRVDEARHFALSEELKALIGMVKTTSTNATRET
jgi:chromatin remodeling complex protein RSC6